MAESLVRQLPDWRPLEPDAGNAAEGSEGPMPDWPRQPCDLPRMAFLFYEPRITRMEWIGNRTCRT
jgi:hypothetical protein